MRFVPFLLALMVLVLALTGCPPPPDDPAAVRPPAPPRVETGQDPPETGPDAPDQNDPAVRPDVPEDLPAGTPPEVAAGDDSRRRVSYRTLRGGVFVPRCPECGEVQPEGSRKCQGCNQVLIPWRQETGCTVCSGAGRCEHCGDDRECSACDADGVCPYCAGTGKIGDAACVECDGASNCGACGGDGFRERHGKDFLPTETALSGVCPTCIDGSGICPECGAFGTDGAGGTCSSCAGEGLCHDCGGNGRCPHDAGDGNCVACLGGGVEVVNGPPRPAHERTWNVRTTGGSVVTGRMPKRPNPNLHIVIRESNKDVTRALTRNKVDPLSYFLAKRAWAESANDYMSLATEGEKPGLYALAIQALRYAGELDPEQQSTTTATINKIRVRRAEEWLQRATRADAAGDAELATLLLRMVEFDAAGTGTAQRARAIGVKVRRRLAEQETPDAETAERLDSESRARVARTLARARLRLQRAEALLQDAEDGAHPAQGVERLFRRADRAAWSAHRLIAREVYREPPSQGRWEDTNVVGRIVEARKLRGRIGASHARAQIVAGRFDYALRLARRALRHDATNPLAKSIEVEATRGIARRAVHRATPPPR